MIGEYRTRPKTRPKKTEGLCDYLSRQFGEKFRSDGTSLIYLQYCYNWDPDLKTLLNTGIEIPAGYWDKQKECITANLPREYGPCDKLNEELDRFLSTAR